MVFAVVLANFALFLHRLYYFPCLAHGLLFDQTNFIQTIPNELFNKVFTSVVLQREAGIEAPFLEFIQRVCAQNTNSKNSNINGGGSGSGGEKECDAEYSSDASKPIIRAG